MPGHTIWHPSGCHANESGWARKAILAAATMGVNPYQVPSRSASNLQDVKCRENAQQLLTIVGVRDQERSAVEELHRPPPLECRERLLSQATARAAHAGPPILP